MMCSANVFISSWRNYCKKLVEENNHYYLVKNNNPKEIWKELLQKGFRCVGPSNVQSYPVICVNLETKIFYSGLVGYKSIGINYNDNKLISYDCLKSLL